jgi:hypothetical protein
MLNEWPLLGWGGQRLLSLIADLQVRLGVLKTRNVVALTGLNVGSIAANRDE